MTLPFNFIAIISFLSFQTDQFYSDQKSTPKNVSLNGRKVDIYFWKFELLNSISLCSNDIMTDIEWLKVIEGSVLSMGQVYAVQVTLPCYWHHVQLLSPGSGDQSADVAGGVSLQPPPGAPVSPGSGYRNYSTAAFPRSFILLNQSLYFWVTAPEDYSSVYSGLWGYSCILSMAAVAWAQFPFSVWVSFCLSHYLLFVNQVDLSSSENQCSRALSM